MGYMEKTAQRGGFMDNLISNKVIKMERNITSEDLQNALDSMRINVFERYLEKINSGNKRLNLLVRQVIGGLVTYANGLKVLAKEPENGIWYQYDSMFPICRAFLEQYPVICKMIQLYPNEDLYDDYERSLVVREYIQDRAIYYSLKKDPTVESEAKRQEALEIHINNWIEGIKNFFHDETINMKDSNKEESIIEIIKKLVTKYKNKYEPNDDVRINDFIGKALQSNIAYKNQFGIPFRDSFQIYRLLCEETHSNYGAVNLRTRFNGMLSINQSNKQNGEASIFTVTWCLKDIELKLDALLQSM